MVVQYSRIEVGALVFYVFYVAIASVLIVGTVIVLMKIFVSIFNEDSHFYLYLVFLSLCILLLAVGLDQLIKNTMWVFLLEQYSHLSEANNVILMVFHSFILTHVIYFGLQLKYK